MAIKIGKTKSLATILLCTAVLFQLTAFAPISQAWLPVPPTPGTKLDVEADVGSVHFNGEMAEFYVLVSLAGERVDANTNANLY